MSGTDPVEEKLYGLLEIIEQQQAAVRTALEGLQAERAALAQERAALAREVQWVGARLQGEVTAAVSASMTEMGERGTAALTKAVAPLATAIGRASAQAGKAEKALEAMAGKATRNVMFKWFGWVVGLVLVSFAADHALLWYDGRDIEDQRTERAALTADIAKLRANYDEWKRAGMLGKLDHCGPDNRPCIAIDERPGRFGDYSEYRVILGY